ncbi:hypothetical protein Sjap_007187 [Stephania japonica]|uniref:Uncharacterized protein n=1 Tax=Stephania japonica TaxID=461633 RepID=A0AAP0JNT5_9MAGN
MDWSYGIELSFVVPKTGRELCQGSGGTCGFDIETEMMLCFCSISSNSTRKCGEWLVVERGFSALAVMAQTLENRMLEEVEDNELCDKWETSRATTARAFSVLLQQAWLPSVQQVRNDQPRSGLLVIHLELARLD